MNPEHPGNNTNLAVDMPSNVGTDSNMYWPEYLQYAWTYLEKKLLFIMRDNIFTRNLPAQFGMDYILKFDVWIFGRRKRHDFLTKSVREIRRA